ncbi:hypothetical protein NKI72_11985 [Mesorhizobium sp. M0437]|uniref:hypothetical protein n=1 Tax=Mesorhizobium sp. M0437 TaxID=2956945 RepID=UPI003336A4B0
MPAILGGTAGDPSASRHAARKQGLQMKSDHANPSHLRDFTTDARVLLIAGIAVVVATAGLFAGIALLKLIRLATNIAYFWPVHARRPETAGYAAWQAEERDRSALLGFRIRRRRQDSVA